MSKKKPPIGTNALVPVELIEQRIYLIRGHKVMLDRDLAELYQVKPIALRQQVKRNLDRFPEDFMFQLTEKEAELLVSQSVIPSKQSLGGISSVCLHTGRCRHALQRAARQASNTS